MSKEAWWLIFGIALALAAVYLWALNEANQIENGVSSSVSDIASGLGIN
jgi:hypothetical protein